MSRRLRRAWSALADATQGETIYAIAYHSTNEYDFTYSLLAANTEEALSKLVAARPTSPTWPWYRGLRWSFAEWDYLEVGNGANEISEAEFLHDPEYVDLDDYIQFNMDAYADVATCLGALRRELLDRGETGPDTVFLISCGDISEAFLLRGVRALNDADVAQRFVDEHTSIPAANRIRSVEPDQRATFIFSEYERLMLLRSRDVTDPVASGPAKGLSVYDLEDLMPELGAIAIPQLLGLIERHAFARVFTGRGTPDFERYGAFYAEAELATSATFCLVQCADNVTDTHVKQLQALLGRRVELDQPLQLAGTLAENLARVLHELRPNRFPRSEMSPTTNHLTNPEAFLLD